MIDKALYLVESGLSVIPICTDGKKKAACLWKPYQERKPTEAELRNWFRQPVGIGIIGGIVSGGLEILDFDAPDLFPEWRDLAIEAGLEAILNTLPIVKTPSGGFHLYYRCETIEGSLKLAMNAQKETLIETRGEGGYVLAPGSPPECHPDNRPYELLQGDLAAIPVLAEDDRTLLLSLAKAFDETPVKDPVSSSTSSNSSGERPGDAFNVRGDVGSLLSGHGWEQVVKSRQNELWKRPGKTEKCVSATFHTEKRTFYVHSTNAFPFEARKGYSPFMTFALLEYNGDCSEAARELLTLGYGEKQEKKSSLRYENNEFNELNRLSSLLKPKSPPSPPHEAAFYGLAGEWIRRIEPHSEADPAAMLIEFLICFGNAIGRTAHVPLGGSKHHGNLFAVIVGGTSSGAKGTGWGEINFLYRQAFAEWQSDCIKSGLSSGEGLIYAVRDPVMGKEPIKDKGKITAYQEVIKDEGVEEKRLLQIKEEFARTLRVAQREGNTLSAVLRQGWDRGELNVKTKHPITATDAHLSIIGQITPAELKRELTDTESANGFANRFLWGYSKSTKDLPFGGELWRQDLTQPLTSLYDAIRFAQEQGAVRWSNEARPVWQEIYPSLKEDRPGLMGAITARARSQVLRLSLLYALLDENPEIEPVHLQAALAVWDYCERTADFLFGASLGDPVADTILSALRSQPSGMDRTALLRLFGNNQKAERITLALETLKTTGLVVCETKPPTEEGKRTTENWRAVA